MHKISADTKLPPLPESFCYKHDGTCWPDTFSAEQMQAYARAAIERQSVPSDCDVRKIMLAVVPGEDGTGHEVYAKNINEVEAKLFEMGERLEEWELGIRSLAAAPQSQPVQEPVAWRTFDGEGGYSYKPYYENEHYLEYWNNLNPRHLGWVEPLYTKS